MRTSSELYYALVACDEGRIPHDGRFCYPSVQEDTAMKTLAIGLLALLTVVAGGCGKAREAQMAAENAPTANVAGTWTGSAGTGGVFAPVTLTLVQNGTDLSGNIMVGGRPDLNGAVKGNVKGETVNLTLPTVKLGQMFVKQQNTMTGEVVGGLPVTLRRGQ